VSAKTEALEKLRAFLIEGVLLRQRDKLDRAYIEAWLEEFAHDLDRPRILSRYRELRSQLDL
jgi:hypothetical protein